MSFNPANCPTVNDHAVVEFCGNCGYSPGDHEGEEVWFIVKHITVVRDKATDVIVARCGICEGFETPYTIGDLVQMVENQHPKEDHEDPAKTPAIA
jgi:hypothetical protein